jgi:hypothetical protein
VCRDFIIKHAELRVAAEIAHHLPESRGRAFHPMQRKDGRFPAVRGDLATPTAPDIADHERAWMTPLIHQTPHQYTDQHPPGRLVLPDARTLDHAHYQTAPGVTCQPTDGQIPHPE